MPTSSRFLLGAAAALALAQPSAALTPDEAGVIADRIRSMMIPEDQDERIDFVGAVVRLAAHDAMGSGGMDGCLERDNPDNNGLQEINANMDDVYAEYADIISLADFRALTAVVSIRAVGGLVPEFEAGRIDCAAGEDATSDAGLLPAADPAGSTWNHMRGIFVDRMGLSPRDVTALMGAHTLGRAEEQFSSFEGPWVSNNGRFDNQFYRDLINRRWDEDFTTDGTLLHYFSRENNDNEEFIMLDTDVALFVDPDSCTVFGGNGGGVRDCTENPETSDFVRQYAEDMQVWLGDFSSAFNKFMAVGQSGLRVVADRTIGSGYCSRNARGSVNVPDLASCKTSCEEETHCLYYAFCDPSDPGCAGTDAGLCRHFGLQPICQLAGNQAYTTYKSLIGPVLFEKRGGGGGRPRPDGNGGRPRPDGNGGRPRPDGNGGRPRPDGGGRRPRPDGAEGRPRPDGRNPPPPEGSDGESTRPPRRGGRGSRPGRG